MKRTADRTLGTLKWKLAALGGLLSLASVAHAAQADDWTMWGRTPDRNMVSPDKNPPVNWNYDADNPQNNVNIKWVADLGSKSYGNPIVANGMVCVGTNNYGPHHDPKAIGPDGKPIDGGVEVAFDEQTGKELWLQYYSKLQAGRVNDWPGEGLCATAYAEPGRLWYCTNQCHVICLDVSPGNDPKAGPKKMWDVDMMAKLGVFPHNMTSSAIVAFGDLIYVLTGNGVEDTHKHVVAPNAPGIVCFNKNTGAVVWKDNSPGANVLHGQWASVALAKNSKGKMLVLAPMGDAWVRAFEADTGKLVWKFDANPKASIYPQGGRNEIIATPVVVEGRMYIANGQDPEHGSGFGGHLYCVDINGEGDVSAELDNPAAPKAAPGGQLVQPAAPAGGPPVPKGIPNPNSKMIWDFGPGKAAAPPEERMHRSISTVAVYNGMVFAADFDGFLHCLDAATGKQHWGFDLKSEVWGSPLVCDGKVYLGDKDGDMYIFAADKVMNQIANNNLGTEIFGSAVFANDTMYILGMHKLFAIQEPKKK